MKNLKFLILGTIFGIILVKAEVISWFRIQEMFRFQSFHMYGIICSAIVVGIISIQLIKKFKVKTMSGEEIKIVPKEFNKGYIIGGFMFGLGWAMTALINLVVRPHGLQLDSLGAFVLNELKDNPQIVPGATCPRARQFTFQLVSLQRRLKSILGECFERGMQTRGNLRILLHQLACCPHEDGRLQKKTPHFMISRMSSSGVIGTQRPAA